MQKNKNQKNKKSAKPEKSSRKKSANPLTIADQIEETVLDSVNAAAAALAGFEDSSEPEMASELTAIVTSDDPTSEDIQDITVTFDPAVEATPETLAAEGLLLEGEE